EAAGLEPRQDALPVEPGQVELDSEVAGDEPRHLDVVADQLVLLVEEGHRRQVAAGRRQERAARLDLGQVGGGGGPGGDEEEERQPGEGQDAGSAHGTLLSAAVLRGPPARAGRPGVRPLYCGGDHASPAVPWRARHATYASKASASPHRGRK